jgi:hypothetical protein
VYGSPGHEGELTAAGQRAQFDRKVAWLQSLFADTAAAAASSSTITEPEPEPEPAPTPAPGAGGLLCGPGAVPIVRMRSPSQHHRHRAQFAVRQP